MKDVQLGWVQSLNGDIDFQGTIERSQFCRVTAGEDVEFGGYGNHTCHATVVNNVFHEMHATDDVQFEEGTYVDSNIFFNLDVKRKLLLLSCCGIFGLFLSALSLAAALSLSLSLLHTEIPLLTRILFLFPFRG